jgi:hypothetical protein
MRGRPDGLPGSRQLNFAFLHMPKAEFINLVEKLSPTITRNQTRPVGSSESVDPRIMVVITMRLLAGGQPLDLGWPYGIADSTV